MVTKEKILNLVAEFIKEKHAAKTWTPGKDIVRYAGEFFNEKEYIAAIETLLKGWLILGDDTITFEEKFPPLLGKKYGVVTNSGSSSNLLMMTAMKSKNLYKFQDKTKVLVPVSGFPTTVNPILQNNFEPIFVDIELDTLNIDLHEAEKLLEQHKNIKIITFAHVLGNPPNMNRIIELVKKYNLILLEDTCDALNSFYDNKPLGSFGEMASCSFFPAHHITTLGEGGFVACKTKEQKIVLDNLRSWGRNCICIGQKMGTSERGCCGKRFSNWIPSLPNEIFDHRYVYSEIGYNLKPIEIQISVGLKQLEKLPEITKKRKENYKILFDIFSKYEEYFILPKPTLNSDPNWFAFPLTVKNHSPFKKSHFTCFFEDHKIQTRNYFGGNLLLQPAYQSLGYSTEYALSFKNATYSMINSFFLGTSPIITKEQYNYISEITEKFFKSI